MFNYTKAQILSLSVSFFIVISITIILFFLFRNKNIQIRKIPIQITTILIITAELIRIMLLFQQKSFSEIYPSFFCSFLWFWFLFSDFTNGEFSKSCEAISTAGSIAMGTLLIINPFSIIGDSAEYLFANYLTFHHLYFHMLVILHLFLTIALKTLRFEKVYILYIALWIPLLCAIIMPRAYLLNENYMNVLSSPLGFLEHIRLMFGQMVYDVILTISLTLILEMISFICYLIYNRLSKKHLSDEKELQNNDNSQEKILNLK